MQVSAPTDLFVEEIVASTPQGDRIKYCLQCGTCSGICPHGFAMDTLPRRLIAALRVHEFGQLVTNETGWLCVSCFACTEACPADIPLTQGLMSYMKSQLMLRGVIPGELKTAFENSRRYGNVMGESPRKRSDWTLGLPFPVPVLAQHRKPVDVLWYVGDYASYHPRVIRTATAFAKVLNALGISFGILGPEEVSDGDAPRLAGERGLFEMLAVKNIKAMGRHGFGEVVTTDAHAFNVMKNEYPAVGAGFTVKHHTQFLAERLDELKKHLRFEHPRKITYHDPCALGRANRNYVFEEPRRVLEAIPGVELVEMYRNRTTSFCCGGGGGGMWLDGFVWEHTKARTSEWRVMEAARTGAQVLAIACPYEAPRFEDAAKSTNIAHQLAVRDIAELVAEAM